MFTYQQTTGCLTSLTGQLEGTGYSGKGAGLNNPAMQNVPDVGPIPQGSYTIGVFFDDPGGKGPIVAHLIPHLSDEMFGRSGFMIHGDNSQANYSASEGCIILPHDVRQMIAASGDTELQVIS